MAEINCGIIDPDELMRKIRCDILGRNLSIESSYKEGTFTETSGMGHGNILEMNFQSLNMEVYNLQDLCCIEIPPIEKKTGIKGLYKRLVRKSVFWLVKPCLDQQSQFNASVTRAIASLVEMEENICAINRRRTSEDEL